jgi:glutamate-1-semialdehyde 2,1-aminomutase
MDVLWAGVVPGWVAGGVAGLAAIALIVWLRQRLALSLAKHPSLPGHARIARWFSRQVAAYGYGYEQFFDVDGAPAEVAARRRAGFERLASAFEDRHASTRALTQLASESISDLQFTSRYRVPFPFSEVVRSRLGSGSFVRESNAGTLTDLDGNDALDLTGWYGVNLLGAEFYRRCIATGSERVAALGPVLGSYHPLVAENVARLRQVSGLDEVSFHMSGTEAVMQAVTLARYHTRRTHVVRFCGAYHGWWGDVQPGVGNPVDAGRTYTLKDVDAAALRVIASRRDIACVLVNPLQALHPNSPAPSDSALIGARAAAVDLKAYAAWLAALRRTCTAQGIALIFDEVFTGFRLAPGGAQELFGVRADLVTYGKSLGGGLPVGVLCGRAPWMKRFREDRPADICFARGTFNTHPYVMGAMSVFLQAIERPEVQARYRDQHSLWNERAARLNERCEQHGWPLRFANLATIWTTHFLAPSRYNWMLQHYLREQGCALSWVGTGRLIFPLTFDERDYERFVDKVCGAAAAMERDGWWWVPAQRTDRQLRRAVLKEMLQARWREIAGSKTSPRIS